MTNVIAYVFLAVLGVLYFASIAFADAWKKSNSMEEFLRRQMAWSSKTFGTGRRAKGDIEHIRKELVEVEENPFDLKEWLDIVSLGLDGYWRHGGTPETIMPDLFALLKRNEGRTYPAPVSEDEPVEHDRSKD